MCRLCCWTLSVLHSEMRLPMRVARALLLLVRALLLLVSTMSSISTLPAEA